MSTQKVIALKTRPQKGVNPVMGQADSTFELKRVSIPTERDLKDGEVIVRVEHCGIEPSMRAWISEARSYLPPVKIGEAMRSIILGTVVASKSPKFKAGDRAKGTGSWSEYCVLPAKDLGLIRSYEGTSSLDALGALGMTGQTAYWGMTEIGRPKRDDVVVVSGAAGATGSVACQIALIAGAKVVAIAGSEDKCRWLEESVGVHKAINYKDADFKEQFKKHVGFFDVFFDNVGGSILNLALTRLKLHARIVLCGAIEDYNNGSDVKGLTNYQNLIPMRGSMQGFIILDYVHRFKESEPQLAKWISEGKLKSETHVWNNGKGGLEAAPEALVGLFAGENLGKMVVKIWEAEKSKL